jgi:CubicO group peptidase (beta-lactamase class C family)
MIARLHTSPAPPEDPSTPPAFRGNGRYAPALTASTALFLIICAAPLAAQTPDPSSDENFSEVAAAMQRRVDSGPTPSIAIAVARGGKIVWEHAFGKSDIERQQAATANTPYYIASITKTITATALMRLASQKKVDLDQPVNNYLRGAKITSPMWDVSQVTLRRLANHTAGLATYGRDCLVNDSVCDPSPVTAIQRYGVAVWKPGEMFDYSNLGYGVLGEVVAQVSGTDLDSALRRLVFAPLGMSTCSVGPDLTQKKGQASRYAIGAPPLKKSVMRSSTPGASGVYCSAHDLAMFGVFHLKDHAALQQRILSDAAISEMQEPSLDPKERQQYGRAWWIQKDLHGYHGVLAQGGTNDAMAYLQLIPSEDIAVAVVVNTYIDGAAIVDEVLAALLPEYKKNLAAAASVSAPPPAPQPPPAEVPSEMVGSWTGFVGTYKGKMPLNVTIDATGHLVAKLAEQPEVSVARARFGNKVFRGSITGSLGVEGEPFTLALKLFFRDGLLVGDAETSPLPTNPHGFQTFYWVQLKSDK